MEQTIIYYLHKGDDIPFYIGKTNNLYNRKYIHKKTFGSETEMFILEKVDINKWRTSEQYWISQFRTWGFELVNKNDGGGGLTQCNFGPERGEKISIAIKGKVGPNKGKKLSEDHIDKIKAKRGYLKSRVNNWSLTPVIQLNLEGNFIKEWESQRQAQLYFNKPNSDGIGACCRGEQKTAYGYKWKFK
jgi:hypothetical protein